MIDPHAITTYAQFNEDLVLRALLWDVKKGFYIDVGANYPTIDSVTKNFYDEGWSGINIEPLKNLHSQLKHERPRDINLQIGLGESSREAVLREYTDAPGHSTFVDSQKKEHGKEFAYVDYTVVIRPLSEILDKHAPKHIHFIKIDVEGFEYQVIKGGDWKRHRPEVICIELNHMGRNWRPLLTKQSYRLFISDGLNEYYVAEERWERTKGFAEKIVKLEYHALKQHQFQSWSSDSVKLTELHLIIQDLQDNLDALNKELELSKHAMSLTLSGKTFPIRIKRAAYGLTLDWIKFKKNKS